MTARPRRNVELVAAEERFDARVLATRERAQEPGMPSTALLATALLAYSVHEHQLGHVHRVELWLTPEHLSLQDDGRGMGLHREGYVQDLLGTLAGRTPVVQLHGIGLSLVAAVAPRLEIESRREGILRRQAFELGVPAGEPSSEPCGPETGTRITLTGLPPPSDADVAALRAQSEVWRAAHPALRIVLHPPRPTTDPSSPR